MQIGQGSVQSLSLAQDTQQNPLLVGVEAKVLLLNSDNRRIGCWENNA